MTRAMAPTHLFAFVTAVALLHVATPARGQTTCEVTSTFAGRWYRAELSCNTSASGTPRAAAVKSQALQSCPLLAGDRVAVEYENDDPRRQPQVTNVDARGSGGPSSGDWCRKGLAPGLFTGPCALVESLPRELRTPVAGETFVRTATITWFRDTNDSRTSVSPGGCSPIALTSGVYRIYITQEIRHTTWEGCANDASRLCEASTYETNRFEGGIFVDEELAPSAVVIDVGPFVRGWNVIEQAPKAAPVALPPGAIPEHSTLLARDVRPAHAQGAPTDNERRSFPAHRRPRYDRPEIVPRVAPAHDDGGAGVSDPYTGNDRRQLGELRMRDVERTSTRRCLMRTFAALVAVSTVVAQLPAGAVGQVIPTINAPGQQLNAPPPNTIMTLLVPVQLQELHTTITRAAVECELLSYDANGNRFSNDAQGWSDTLTVPPDGNLSVDVVVHMQEAFSGSRDGDANAVFV